MENYELNADEVVLYEGGVSANIAKGRLQLTLTSQKLVVEKEKVFSRKNKS